MADTWLGQLKKLSVEELEELLISPKFSFDRAYQQTIHEELTRRRLKDLKTPHWTLTPAFWVSVVAAIAACIAAAPVVKDWFSGPQERKPAFLDPPMKDEAPKSQPQSPPSPATPPARSKK